MQAQRRELKNKQHKLLVYLADLYTQHRNSGADKMHQAGTTAATCQICHEIKVIHEIIDEISAELKKTAAPAPRRRRRRKASVTNEQLAVFCLSTQNGANYFIRAANLTAAIDLLGQQNKNVVAYTTVAPSLYAAIPLTDHAAIKNIAQLLGTEPDFTGIITVRSLRETPAMSY